MCRVKIRVSEYLFANVSLAHTKEPHPRHTMPLEARISLTEWLLALRPSSRYWKCRKALREL